MRVIPLLLSNKLAEAIFYSMGMVHLRFASPCIIILSTEINQKDAATSQVYYLSFKYSSTCFGHAHGYHEELQQLQ